MEKLEVDCELRKWKEGEFEKWVKDNFNEKKLEEENKK